MLQITAMPVAVALLGVEGFIFYGILVSLNSWLLLATSGLSPALSVKISGLHDISNSREWISSAYALFAAIGSILFVLGMAVNYTAPPTLLVPDGGGLELISNAKLSISILLVSFVMQCFSIVSDAVMAGLERQYLTNLSVLTGTLLSFGFILLSDFEINNPSDLICVVVLPAIIVRFLVGTVFIASSGLFVVEKIRKDVVMSLIGSALTFFKSTSLVNFLLHVLPVSIVGKFYPEALAAQYLALNTLVILFASLITFITLPLIPALRRSRLEGKSKWSDTAQIWLKRYTVLLIFSTIILAPLIGEDFLFLIFEDGIDFSFISILAATLYFSTLVWSNYTFSQFAVIDRVEIIGPFFLRKACFSLLFLTLSTYFGFYFSPYLLFFAAFFIFEFFQIKKIRGRV